MGLDGLHDPFFVQPFFQSSKSFINGITWSNFHGGHATKLPSLYPVDHNLPSEDHRTSEIFRKAISRYVLGYSRGSSRAAYRRPIRRS